MPFHFFEDAADGRRARLAREDKQAQELAEKVIKYLDKQLNGCNSEYINAYDFDCMFPGFKNNTKAHKYVFSAGYSMCRTLLSGEYVITKKATPSPAACERFGCFVL